MTYSPIRRIPKKVQHFNDQIEAMNMHIKRVEKNLSMLSLGTKEWEITSDQLEYLRKARFELRLKKIANDRISKK